MRIVSWQEGATRVSPVSESSRQALQQHLLGAGELFRSNALHPRSLFQDVTEFQESLFAELS